MAHEAHDPELKALESALADLSPLAGQFNRDALMFAAGKTAAKRAGHFWPALSCVLAASVVGMGIALTIRPTPPAELRFVQVPSSKSPSSTAAMPIARERETSDAETSGPVTQIADERNSTEAPFLKLEREVLYWGVDALPTASLAAHKSEPPLTVDSLLGRPAEKPDRSDWFLLKRILNFGDRS